MMVYNKGEKILFSPFLPSVFFFSLFFSSLLLTNFAERANEEKAEKEKFDLTSLLGDKWLSFNTHIIQLRMTLDSHPNPPTVPFYQPSGKSCHRAGSNWSATEWSITHRNAFPICAARKLLLSKWHLLIEISASELTSTIIAYVGLFTGNEKHRSSFWLYTNCLVYLIKLFLTEVLSERSKTRLNLKRNWKSFYSHFAFT